MEFWRSLQISAARWLLYISIALSVVATLSFIRDLPNLLDLLTEFYNRVLRGISLMAVLAGVLDVTLGWYHRATDPLFHLIGRMVWRLFHFRLPRLALDALVVSLIALSTGLRVYLLRRVIQSQSLKQRELLPPVQPPLAPRSEPSRPALRDTSGLNWLERVGFFFKDMFDDAVDHIREEQEILEERRRENAETQRRHQAALEATKAENARIAAENERIRQRNARNERVRRRLEKSLSFWSRHGARAAIVASLVIYAAFGALLALDALLGR